ncbi:hypothetical protein PHET_00592 [Paragonimus heterotremus]|uniref:Uncharacterized protein n=1 Tax=Paragonimus heterotremus TaxID=100268 RepID=A0A8J4T4R3_9TREM|nr:hypothetical protein PHET_00592 [Paragonimus heterotremus]
MNLLSKGILMTSCAVGVLCTMGAALTYQDIIVAKSKTPIENATTACIFISLILFGIAIICVLQSLCCFCSNRVLGLFISLFAGTATLMITIGYAAFHKPELDRTIPLPFMGEWLFGGIMAGLGAFFMSILVTVS